MRFLDAWAALPMTEFLRMSVPAALLALASLVPGRPVAAFTALGIALSLPFLRPIGVPAPAMAGWTLLWLVVTWGVSFGPREAPRKRARLGGLESGTIGLLLGLALLALAVAGVARLDLAAVPTRWTSYGVLLAGLGLLHLMLRRHVARAAAAFAAMGLGLQVLTGVLRLGLASTEPAATGLPLLAAALAVGLALRIAYARESALGSGWVSDAHDLHD
ncbi:MAG TPA: hypothetical protein VMS88_03060 [Terriglobales bacterium]|nr:hypothetical protein [Terriglobales bacterium]